MTPPGSEPQPSIFFFEQEGTGSSSLIRAVGKAGNVYFPVICYPDYFPGGQSGISGTSAKAVQDFVAGGEGKVPAAGSVKSVFPQLGEVTEGMGHINTSPDPDGFNRRFPLVYRYADGYVLSLVLIALCDFLQVPIRQIRFIPGHYLLLPGVREEYGAPVDLKIPIDSKGRIILNYAGPWEDSFNVYPDLQIPPGKLELLLSQIVLFKNPALRRMNFAFLQAREYIAMHHGSIEVLARHGSGVNQKSSKREPFFG